MFTGCCYKATSAHCASVCRYQTACERYLQCLTTLIPVWVSHTAISGLCACSLCPSFTVVWRHSWLMAVNSTSVKASKCGQLKSRSARKDGWLLLVQRRLSILFSRSHFSFLMQRLELRVWQATSPQGPLLSLLRRTHTHTHLHLFVKVTAYLFFKEYVNISTYVILFNGSLLHGGRQCI